MSYREDHCLVRKGFAPENNARCKNIAIALIIHKIVGADVHHRPAHR